MISELINYGFVVFAVLFGFCGFLGIRAVIYNYGYDKKSFFFFTLMFIFFVCASILRIIQLFVIEGAICIF